MTFVFIPRRQDKLAHTAQKVKALGFTPLTMPLLHMSPLKITIPEKVTGVVVTSSAALEALPPTTLPLYCVGGATATTAQKRGFYVAHIGQSDATTLATWIEHTLTPQTLLHPTTYDAESDWYTLLRAKGFEIQAVQAYQKAYAQELPDEVVCCLTENKVSFTLVFSVQSARQLLKLCQTHKIALKTLGTVVAISDKVAAVFEEKHPQQLNVRVAKHPQQQEMLNVLEQTT